MTLTLSVLMEDLARVLRESWHENFGAEREEVWRRMAEAALEEVVRQIMQEVEENPLTTNLAIK